LAEVLDVGVGRPWIVGKLVSLMNTQPLATWVQALVFRAPGYSKKSLCLIFVLSSAPQAFAWTDGELLIWISSNRTFHALSGLGRFLGTIRMCTGALGFISLKANVLPFRRPIGCAEGRIGFYGSKIAIHGEPLLPNRIRGRLGWHEGSGVSLLWNILRPVIGVLMFRQ
jgi:hypothetical protein